jgi:hypothetical protein
MPHKSSQLPGVWFTVYRIPHRVIACASIKTTYLHIGPHLALVPQRAAINGCCMPQASHLDDTHTYLHIGPHLALVPQRVAAARVGPVARERDL